MLTIQEIIRKKNSKVPSDIQQMYEFFQRSFKEDVDSVKEMANNAKEEISEIFDEFKGKAQKEIDGHFQEQQKETIGKINDYFPEAKMVFEKLSETKLSEANKKIDSVLSQMETRMENAVQRIEKSKGVKGDKGDRGMPGINGDDGSPDTGEQIIEKINGSKGKISFNRIAGLLEELEKIKNAITRGGGSSRGGGMGNAIHEVHDISSATTGVTLGSKVAGNGTAVFSARYQGQVLDIDVHYTISGKQVTFVGWTPEDATKFSISYIRG